VTNVFMCLPSPTKGSHHGQKIVMNLIHDIIKTCSVMDRIDQQGLI